MINFTFWWEKWKVDTKKHCICTIVVWEISPGIIPYIDHWQRVKGLTPDGGLKVGKICKETTPHPYLVVVTIEGEELQLLRYAYPEDTDGNHIPNRIFWGFYHIFEPDDLTKGYHSFNVIFYAGKEKGEWLENLNALEFWQGMLPWLEIQSLLIYVKGWDIEYIDAFI